MSFFDSISHALGTDSSDGWGGSIGKSLGLDNNTIASLRLPALAAGAYFGLPYLSSALGGSGAAATGAAGDLAAADAAAGLVPEFGSSAAYSSGLNGGGGWLSGLASGVGGAGNLASLAGAALGALGSGDTTTTASKDPWKPAQPYLLNNLMQNAAMQQHYAANPFSNEQKQAYQGVMDANANAMANVGGLLANANAFGQSKGGRMPAMTGLLSGITAPKIDYSQYSNIGQKKA